MRHIVQDTVQKLQESIEVREHALQKQKEKLKSAQSRVESITDRILTIEIEKRELELSLEIISRLYLGETDVY